MRSDSLEGRGGEVGFQAAGLEDEEGDVPGRMHFFGEGLGEAFECEFTMSISMLHLLIRIPTFLQVILM